jgi:hypothetical protein
MSSKPQHTIGSDKVSRSERRAAAEATDFNYCPHCGGELDRRLAQHMARGLCGEYTSRSEESAKTTPDPRDSYPAPPTLDTHAEREHPPDDLDDRRELADELADADVWV